MGFLTDSAGVAAGPAINFGDAARLVHTLANTISALQLSTAQAHVAACCALQHAAPHNNVTFCTSAQGKGCYRIAASTDGTLLATNGTHP